MNDLSTPRPLPLHEQDETAWLEQTATLVAQGRFGEIDPQHLSEYLAGMARRDKREVLSRLVTLLAHLLKWDARPDQRSNSWRATILLQRQELQDLLESGTLHNYAGEVLGRAYEWAVQRAVLEVGLQEQAFPPACPWSLDEAVSQE